MIIAIQKQLDTQFFQAAVPQDGVPIQEASPMDMVHPLSLIMSILILRAVQRRLTAPISEHRLCQMFLVQRQTFGTQRLLDLAHENQILRQI